MVGVANYLRIALWENGPQRYQWSPQGLVTDKRLTASQKSIGPQNTSEKRVSATGFVRNLATKCRF
jgi:hypothetical protein